MLNIKYVNAIRSLGLQAIKESGQGHTGMAMSAPPINYSIYMDHMKISKNNPKWINRDRFVLSAGHGSMSLYPILHFAGLINIEEIKNHKCENSKTPGHPEHEHDNFIDASTGPLGQGVAMGVGMAIAQKYLENKFNNISKLIDHNTFVVVGDGCLQEGISYEAMSLAGKLQLNKLIVLHDSNDFQLDSEVSKVFIENLKMRMESQNWYYQKVSNNPPEISAAIKNAKKSSKPSFIEVKTIIGEGTSSQSDASAHGLAVNDVEIEKANKHFDMNYNDFKFDKQIYDHYQEGIIARGNKEYTKWEQELEQCKKISALCCIKGSSLTSTLHRFNSLVNEQYLF